MIVSAEPLVSESGEMLWPVETILGDLLLRSIDVQVQIIKESSADYRFEVAQQMYPLQEDEGDFWY